VIDRRIAIEKFGDGDGGDRTLAEAEARRARGGTEVDDGDA
jgi:hypothetical protein